MTAGRHETATKTLAVVVLGGIGVVGGTGQSGVIVGGSGS